MHACVLTGKVTDVKFLDVEVAQAQITWGHMLASGTSTPPPRAEAISALRGLRLLVIVCEYKVLVHDLMSRRTQELPRSVVFEGKAPVCVAFLFQVRGPAQQSKQSHLGRMSRAVCVRYN